MGKYVFYKRKANPLSTKTQQQDIFNDDILTDSRTFFTVVQCLKYLTNKTILMC